MSVADVRAGATLQLPILTADEATRRLPMVRRVVRDFTEAWKQLASLEEDLYAREGRTVRGLRQPEKEIDATLEALEEELRQVDALIDDPTDGSVVFHGQLDGQDVCLSWRPEDEEVSHWYGLDEAEPERRLLESTS